MLVNYLRKSLGQKSGGHISPVGAFNEEHDVVLIMDTAAYKYPWTWVKVEKLWNAMACQVDPGSTQSRGYLVISPLP